MIRTLFDATDERRIHGHNLAAFPAAGEPVWLRIQAQREALGARLQAETTAAVAGLNDTPVPPIASTRFAARAARFAASLSSHRHRPPVPQENSSVSQQV